MTRIAFLKKYLLRFAVVLAMVGVIVYMLAHALGLSSGSLHTIPVQAITDRQVTSTTAYLFRDERVLTSEVSGLVDTIAENGSKVGKNVSVAQVYASSTGGELLSEAQVALDTFNRLIRVLKNSETSAGTSVSVANEYRNQAKAEYLAIRQAVTSGSLKGLLISEDDFLTLLNRYLTLSGKSESASTLLEQLQAQKDLLLKGQIIDIKNDDDGLERSSGTFYDHTYVDGYEGIFTMSALQQLTLQTLESLKNATPKTAGESGTTVGKMIYGYSWYLALTLDASVAEQFRIGSVYSFTFPENHERTMKLTLERTETGDGETLLIFQATDMPEEFDYYRSQTVEITVNTCEGFYIPDSAVQEITETDGTTLVGVYIFENSTVCLRHAEVLYSGDGYYIVARPQDSGKTEISKNDILITSGRNLYNGKVYQ